jgi:DNA-binding protein H-NS
MKKHEELKLELKLMPIEELWSLHEKISFELARKIAFEKARLDQRLRQLALTASPEHSKAGIRSSRKENGSRRPYPRVLPKYINPAQPGQTWAGRGKQPRWLTAELRSGKKLDDFRIS